MRYILALVAVAAVAGTAAAATSLEAPQLTLKSKAGTLTGKQGSGGCISSNTVIQCADGLQPHPDLVSVVRPGERLVVKTSAGTLWNPHVSIGALGCSGSGRSKALRHPNGVWQFTAPRRRGAYELLVSSRFDTDEAHGDTSVAFGVVVSRTKARRIVPASQYAVC
jgi:hypothetical protein